ncbi:MAG: hypothetical protein ACHP9Z_18960 [Streptosporangiales bacterium]
MTTPAPARLAISVTGLRKSFGGTAVLDGTDLAVPEGMIFALLSSCGGRRAEGPVRCARSRQAYVPGCRI